MTADRDALVERVAKAINSSMIYLVEPDTRVGQMTSDELGLVAVDIIDLIRAEVPEEAATAIQNLWRIEDCYGAAAAIRALKAAP